jgi:hypothetical protein
MGREQDEEAFARFETAVVVVVQVSALEPIYRIADPGFAKSSPAPERLAMS